jgi:hypothetical protein
MKLECDESLSNFAFSFNLSRYKPAVEKDGIKTMMDRTDWPAGESEKPTHRFSCTGRESAVMENLYSMAKQTEAGAYTRPLFSSS